jgi:hypothetical protein
MSFRDHASNIMDNLIATAIWTACVLAVKFWPRIVATLTALRIAVSSRSAALLRRLRALLPTRAKIGQLMGRSGVVSQSYGAMHGATPNPPQNTLIVPGTGSLAMTKAPEPMPPGTASAIVMAMQPPVQRAPMPSMFLNNSDWTQWQAARAAHHHSETGMLMAMQAHEQELERARFAMRSTMPKYNHALTT